MLISCDCSCILNVLLYPYLLENCKRKKCVVTLLIYGSVHSRNEAYMLLKYISMCLAAVMLLPDVSISLRVPNADFFRWSRDHQSIFWDSQYRRTIVLCTKSFSLPFKFYAQCVPLVFRLCEWRKRNLNTPNIDIDYVFPTFISQDLYKCHLILYVNPLSLLRRNFYKIISPKFQIKYVQLILSYYIYLFHH